MAKRLPAYDNLPILPWLVAEVVATSPPSELGFSSQRGLAALQESMTQEQIREFCDLCDRRCRHAYSIKAQWMMKIATSKTCAGRDQLYMWTAHWLEAYLRDPEGFRRTILSAPCVTAKVTCDDCKGVWTEVYKLDGLADISRGDKAL